MHCHMAKQHMQADAQLVMCGSRTAISHNAASSFSLVLLSLFTGRLRVHAQAPEAAPDGSAEPISLFHQDWPARLTSQ